jgi:O-glycosyl hydrolase
VRAAFTKWNVNAKIMAPEDVADSKRYPTFLKPFESDPAALAALDIMNIHGEPREGAGEGSQAWTALQTRLKALKRPMWMTETSGEDPTWLGAGKDGHGGLALARSIHNAVVFGGCEAWVYWAITDPAPSEFALMGLATPTPKYSTLKQYSRFIRPGAVRIAVTPASSTILASAFLDDGRGKVTIVFVNMNATDTPITGTLASLSRPLAEFQAARSSSTEDCQPLASVPVVDGKLSLTLKAQSVTTLVGSFAPSR